jgi:hypothetical protein
MSVEDKARKANLKFWRLDDDLSGSNEEAEEATADEVEEEAKEAAADEVDSESEYDFEAEDGDDAEAVMAMRRMAPVVMAVTAWTLVDRTLPLRRRRRKGRIERCRHSAPSSKSSRM